MTHPEKTFGPSKFYALDERVGETWVPMRGPRFTQRDTADAHRDDLAATHPERKFRVVVVWP